MRMIYAKGGRKGRVKMRRIYEEGARKRSRKTGSTGVRGGGCRRKEGRGEMHMERKLERERGRNGDNRKKIILGERRKRRIRTGGGCRWMEDWQTRRRK